MTEKPIHIVHVMPQIGIGGAETQLYALIINSDSQVVTHEVLYYSDSRDDEGFKLYTKAGIKYARIPRNKKRPIKFLRDLAAAIKARKPDIVQCWLSSGSICGRLAAILAGHKKIIVTYRGGQLGHPLFTRCLEFFTGNKVYHLANSNACANMTAKRTGIAPAKYDVIYNGVDIKRFTVEPIREQLKKQYNIPDDAKIVTMVGRLTASKNYPMLLRLAQKAKQENLNCHFLIVGHGEREQDLKDLVFQLDLNDIIHFLGLRHDVPAILKSSDIFCYTTLFEGFPNALLEAMTAGLPIITTDFDGVKELIQDGINGKIVNVNDIEKAYAALKYYIGNDEVMKKYGLNCQEKVFNDFTISKMVERTILYYEKIS